MNVVKHSGANYYRLALSIDQTNNGANWSTYDKLFKAAWENGITLLPGLSRTNSEGHRFLTSSDPGWSGWYTWVKEAVKRYGYGGSFWAGKANPKPATAWEIWNEPNLLENNPIISKSACEQLGQSFNAEANTCVQPQNYGAFLVYTAAAVRQGQQEQNGGGTTVLFGGLYMPAGENYNTFMKKTSGVPGAPSSYDAVSIHPYGLYGKVGEMAWMINDIRSELNTSIPSGSNKSLWVTELGWPVGGSGVPTVSEAEQASLLTQSFNWIKAEAASKNIQNVTWYNSRDLPVSNWDGYCGLRNGYGSYRPAWSAFQAQTGAAQWIGDAIQGEDDNGSGPHLVGLDNGTIDSFFRTPSGRVGHSWTQGGSWSQEDLWGSSIDNSSVPHPVVRPASGVVDVFWRTPSGGLGHAWDATGWNVDMLPGSLASDPHPVIQPDGTIDVFFRTPSGELGHAWYQPGGQWLGNTLPGSVASDPYPVGQPSGTIDVFYRTASGGLGHSWTEGGSWSQQDISGASINSAGVPHPVIQDNGTIDVFWRTPSDGFGHAWNDWQGWHATTLSGTLASDPRPVIQPNGTIDVLYRTPSGGLGHNWYQAGGSWFSNTVPGSVSSEPYPVVQPNGTIDVLYRNPSGGLGHSWTQGGSWFSNTVPGSIDSKSWPHAFAQADGTIDALYRTPTGGLGHSWTQGGSWSSNTLVGSVALDAPKATTEAATGVGGSEATLNATVNPEGSSTSYYFEYGKTTAYGTKKPTSPLGIGSGTSDVAVAQTVSGLSANTLYHFRVVATSSAGGTSYGVDKTFTTTGTSIAQQLANMAVTEPFDGSSASLQRFASEWTATGWASGTSPKGQDTTSGWGPLAAYPTINGAFFGTTVSDTGSGVASVVTLAQNPTIASRYFSLWLDMPTPSSTKAGYELRFTEVSAGAYLASLSKWEGGVQKVLTEANAVFSKGISFALVDQGSQVSGWLNSGSGFTELLSFSDSAFSSGKAAVEGAGNITRLTNFKAGSL